MLEDRVWRGDQRAQADYKTTVTWAEEEPKETQIELQTQPGAETWAYFS